MWIKGWVLEFSHRAFVATWITEGDNMNIDLFSIYRKKAPDSLICVFLDSTRILHTQAIIVLDVAFDFFERIFTTNASTSMFLAREEIWFHVALKMCLALMASILS